MTDSPVSQSIRIGFRVLQLSMLALFVAWLAGNVRRVPPDKQAVVLRFGRVVAVKQSGLVVSLPRPIQQVVLLPGPTTQMDMTISAAHRAIRYQDFQRGIGSPTRSTEGAFLTGDNGVILLDSQLTWRVSNAAEYLLAQDRVEPALQRLFVAAATDVAAAHTAWRASKPPRSSPSNSATARPAAPACSTKSTANGWPPCCARPAPCPRSTRAAATL